MDRRNGDKCINALALQNISSSLFAVPHVPKSSSEEEMSVKHRRLLHDSVVFGRTTQHESAHK